jgi:hypothetical protein
METGSTCVDWVILDRHLFYRRDVSIDDSLVLQEQDLPDELIFDCLDMFPLKSTSCLHLLYVFKSVKS